MVLDEDKSKEVQTISAASRFWLAIKQFGQTILKEWKVGLTFEQTMVLHLLAESDGLDLGTIAVRTDRERTTTTRMIDGLEKANMVVRITDKQDARRKLVYLTKKGRDKVEEIHKMADEFTAVMSRGVTEEQIRTTVFTLNTMIANVCQATRERSNGE